MAQCQQRIKRLREFKKTVCAAPYFYPESPFAFYRKIAYSLSLHVASARTAGVFHLFNARSWPI
jgi:hypothetical protein